MMPRHLYLGIGMLLCGGTATGLPASEPSFRVRPIDTQAEFNSCAVWDVNGDGRPDVVCGGAWYAAPDWQRHEVRNVDRIRGRFDDYACLPLDVNGDGRLDLVSANYRSESLYWVEQPADLSQPWPLHVIDRPGPMETGRLADVNQDGQLDVLPNGVGFAAWWQLERPSTNDAHASVRWVRHDLPQALAGHGIGLGDIDGDGRVDLVGPRGWLAAPPARESGQWTWHADFELDRDASIPIVIRDVDGDGDADIVWGRGHGVGLYWLEQIRDSNQARHWTRHAIDTSWSQAHSLLAADLDGDGRDELLAGKRYLGHDGHDIGEYDPLVIYSYAFDLTQRSWRRTTLAVSRNVGFGLDPKAADMDGDGDLDLVVADRCGLYLLENLRSETLDHRQLLAYRDDNGHRQAVASRADWDRRRAEILRGLEAAMGPLPPTERRVPLDLQVVETQATAHYLRRKVTFATEPGDRVPAWLLIPTPEGVKRPAMLCLHQTVAIGKDEPAGLGGRPTLHYAHELAERGYVCLVPDYPSFGEYPSDFSRHRDRYASGSMQAIWNNMRAVDLLISLPDVDHDRIGCIGHSLGGHNALFTAVFDQRLRAVVSSCGFTAFHAYYGGDLRGWTSDRYMPRIASIYSCDPDRVPFDFHEVLAALAPRPVFVNAPLHDNNFDVAGVRQVMDEAAHVYALWDASQRLHAVYPNSEHDFPDEVRQACYEWLDQQLGGPH